MTPCGNEDIQSFRIGYRAVLAWQGICFSGIFQSGCKPWLLLCREGPALQLSSVRPAPASVHPAASQCADSPAQGESLLCLMSLGSLLVFALNLNLWISTCSAAVGWALWPPLGIHLCLSQQSLCLMELVSSLTPPGLGLGSLAQLRW